MKHKRLHAITDDGFSQWLEPIQNFRMVCCDCGLVHELQFEVLKVKGVADDDTKEFNAKKLRWGEYRISFRARRNNRSTAAVRRHKK